MSDLFRHHLHLALRSLRHSPALTALMVLALALGIGAAMTTLTVFRVLGADPLPHKSGRVFTVQLAADPIGTSAIGAEPPLQLTRFDAQALLHEHRGVRQAMMTGGGLTVQPEAAGLQPFVADARYTTADFFALFDAPWQFGQGWSAADDQAAARVAVISDTLNRKLFDGADSRGRMLRVDGRELRIVGVLAAWQPAPHFFDLSGGAYRTPEDVILPFATAMDLKFGFNGSMSCWGKNNTPDRRAVDAPCAWLQYWLELPDAAQAADFRQYLQSYAQRQHDAGRFERPALVRLRSVTEWLEFRQVVPADVKLQLWLAFGFLLVCLTNTVGLLLAKCLRRAPEIGVRRALGATRRDVFAQFLIEAGVIGVAGAALGLLLALAGLWAVRQNPASYARLAELDAPMLALTVALGLGASLLAGLLPAWRACQVTPALQLKSQ
jgi:putative ABC transport system permease protein